MCSDPWPQWVCERCDGSGDDLNGDDDFCPACHGWCYVVPRDDLRVLVEKAMNALTENVGDRQCNPLHIRNVIENHGWGPRLPYGRVKYLLGRHPRATYLRSKQSLGEALPYYLIAEREVVHGS